MDLNATIDIIIKDLHEARDIIDDLKKYPGVPALQVELAKSKCRSAAEVIALLKDLHEKLITGAQEQQVKEESKPERKEERPEKVPERAEMIKEIPEVKAAPVMNLVINTHEEDRHVINQAPISAIIYDATREPKPPVKKQADNAIIADKFNNMGESFNEKLASLKHEDDVSDIFKTKPLSNLSEAIGINDRFLFIREIFKGDTESYNNAILKLDSAGNLDDAKALFAGYTGDDTDAEAVRQLMDLLKRKFHTNE
jgi:hypothetical protein